MTSFNDRLYNLIPAIYRIRDEESDGPLRALLSVIGQEVDVVERDIEQLYDNWFIETCDEWVVPYIADLLGVKALVGSSSGDGQSAFTQRSYVTNTLAYRRRKGTAAVLEQLGSDVTGWRCTAVEFFERTACTQHMNHPRPSHHLTPDIRSTYANQFYGGPFEQATHLADVRHIDNRRGFYNVPNVGLFLWRLQSYLLDDVSARQIDPLRYTFDPLGKDVAIYTVPQTEATMTTATQPVNVPMPISGYSLEHDLPLYYGDANSVRSLCIAAAGVIRAETTIRACTLTDAGTGWAHTPVPGATAVDPELGRIAFDVAPAGDVTVSYAYGFGGDLGGGPYDRRASIDSTLLADVVWQMGVSHAPPASQTSIVATLGEAVKEWNKQPAGTTGVIALMDSRTYTENLTTAAKRIKIPEGSQLLIVAAGWPATMVNGNPTWRAGQLAPTGVRPHLRGTIEVIGTAPAASAAPGRLLVNGVLIEGAFKVLAGHLGELHVAHSTLAPGVSSFSWGDNEALTITLARSICAALTPGSSATTLQLKDSIVLGDVDGRDVHIDACTVIGSTKAETLQASNAVLLDTVTVQRRQEGCVRFSYLPLDSDAPRRHRCQPEDGAGASRVRPHFESLRYGDPAFALLTETCATEIVTGADDEGEMGAWHFVQAPLRLRNLRIAIDEYLRFGLEAGVCVITPRRTT